MLQLDYHHFALVVNKSNSGLEREGTRTGRWEEKMDGLTPGKTLSLMWVGGHPAESGLTRTGHWPKWWRSGVSGRGAVAGVALSPAR